MSKTGILQSERGTDDRFVSSVSPRSGVLPGFSMVALCFLGMMSFALLAGDADDDITSVVTTLSSALSDGNPQLFLKTFDKGMPDYSRIQKDVQALAADTLISCSVDVIAIRGAEADLDWYMVLRSQHDRNLIERRRTKVTLKAERRGKNWVVTSFSPLSVFAPLKLR